jgi:hypothetical protein
MIALDLHATTATVAELAAAQLVIYQFVIDWQTGGQTFNDGDQRSSV